MQKCFTLHCINILYACWACVHNQWLFWTSQWEKTCGPWNHELMNVLDEEANRIFQPQSFTLFHTHPPTHQPTHQPTNKTNNHLRLPCYCIHSLFLDTCFLSWLFLSFGSDKQLPMKTDKCNIPYKNSLTSPQLTCNLFSEVIHLQMTAIRK